MTTLKNELKTYGELDDFLLEGDNWARFKEIFGFSPTNTYIKKKLKRPSNFLTDVEIIEKVLEPLPDKYVVGEWYESWEIFTGNDYAMSSSSIIWVHKILEEEE